MGTRADFYVGKGKDAKWVGSIGWDGYPLGIPEKILKAKSLDAFKRNVATFVKNRPDGTLPKDGWPWPWEDSIGTDYAYAYDQGVVLACHFGSAWFNPLLEPPLSNPKVDPTVVFPNMKDKQKVTFGKRSGLMVFGPKGIIT